MSIDVISVDVVSLRNEHILLMRLDTLMADTLTIDATQADKQVHTDTNGSKQRRTHNQAQSAVQQNNQSTTNKKKKSKRTPNPNYISQQEFINHFDLKMSKKLQMFLRYSGVADKSRNWRVSRNELGRSREDVVREVNEWETLNLSKASDLLDLSPALTQRLIDENKVKGYTQSGRKPTMFNQAEYRRCDLLRLKRCDGYAKALEEHERAVAEQRAYDEKVEAECRRIYEDVTVNVRRRTDSIEHAVVFAGPTNSGKTYRAMELLSQNYEKNPSGKFVYAGPLRMLAKENYDKLVKRHGEDAVGYLTGEEQINPSAPIVCCTPEMAPMEGDTIVLDETHWVVDRDRGHNWTNLLIGGTFKNFYTICATETADDIARMLGDAEDIEIVKCERATPIEFKGFVHYKSIPKHSAVICFSEKCVLAMSSLLNRNGISACALYGSMPLVNRQRQIDAYVSGKFDVVVTTDVIGHGINLPIDNVVFVETNKFDGEERRDLLLWEAAQIAGRAGRFGLSDEGGVYAIKGLDWNDCDVSIVKRAADAAAGRIDTGMKVDGAYITPRFDDMACDGDASRLDYSLRAWMRRAEGTKFEYEVKPSDMPQRFDIIDAAQMYVGCDTFPDALDAKWPFDDETLWKLSGAPLDPENEMLYAIVGFLASDDIESSDVLLNAFKAATADRSLYGQGTYRCSDTDHLFDCERHYSMLMQIKTIGNAFGTFGTLDESELEWTMDQMEQELWRVLCIVERQNELGVCRVCGKPCAPWFFECDDCHSARISWRYMDMLDDDDFDDDDDDIWGD